MDESKVVMESGADGGEQDRKDILPAPGSFYQQGVVRQWLLRRPCRVQTDGRRTLENLIPAAVGPLSATGHG
jgi:hypothetical protein